MTAFSRLLAPSWLPGLLWQVGGFRGGVVVNVVVAALWALVVWLCAVIWLLVHGGPWVLVVVLCPLVVSGLTVGFMFLGAVAAGVRWLWRARATLRL